MSSSVSERTVLIAGATGLVGRECLGLLLDDSTCARVTALVRRAPSGRETHPRLHYAVVDFDRLQESKELFVVDQVVCALGTTIRKAGSQDAFRRVDLEYPLRIAELGLAGGGRHFLLVSSMGANPRSRVFYSRVKGELEEEILGLGYRSVTIIRPSFLLGERSEFRPAEAVMKRLGFLLPRTYRPVQGRRVAEALIGAARADLPGVHILENRDLQAFRVDFPVER